MEKEYGTQMRLKHAISASRKVLNDRGKGVWDSDEIETHNIKGVFH